MQPPPARYNFQPDAAPDTAFVDLPLSFTPFGTPRAPRRRPARFHVWQLGTALSLLFSSGAYVVYALLHLGL